MPTPLSEYTEISVPHDVSDDVDLQSSSLADSYENGRMDAPVSGSPLHGTLSSRQSRSRRAKTDLRKRRSPRFHDPDDFVDIGIASDASPEELMYRLVDQTRQSRILRRTMRVAIDRIQSDAARTARTERARLDAEMLERMRLLNERRLVAQQEASKVAQDLHLSQFQLRVADEKIAQTQQMLHAAERQRDEAELAAAEAREMARQLHQERLLQAAREEGRRLGFEEGLRRGRASHDLAFMDRQDYPSTFRGNRHDPENIHNSQDYGNSSTRRNPEASNPHTVHVHGPETSLPAAFEPVASSSQPLPPPEQSAAFPAPRGSPSPAIQMYSIDIPSASALETRYNLNEEFPGQTSQPWLTADQLLATDDSEPSPEVKDAELSHSDQRFKGQLSQSFESQKPKKESWYRTLSRKFRWKRQPQTFPSGSVLQPRDTAVEDEEGGSQEQNTSVPRPFSQPRSWYQPKPARRHLFDLLKVPEVSPSHSSIDSISQLDIVGPPLRNTTRGTQESPGVSVPGNRKMGFRIANQDPVGGQHMFSKKSLGKSQSDQERSPGFHPSIIKEKKKSSLVTVDQRSRRSPVRASPGVTTPPDVPAASPPAPVGIQIESPSTRDHTSDTRTLCSGRRPPENNFLSPSSTAAVVQPTILSPTPRRASVVSTSPSLPIPFASNTVTPADSGRPGLRSPLGLSETPSRLIHSSMDIHEKFPENKHSPSYPRSSSQPTQRAPRLRSQPLPDTMGSAQYPASLSLAQGSNPLPHAGAIDATTTQAPPRATSVSPQDHTLKRSASNLSNRSGASYSRYDPSTYLDPAFFNHAEGGGNVHPGQPPTLFPTNRSPVTGPYSRAASTSSTLSYVTDPKTQQY